MLQSLTTEMRPALEMNLGFHMSPDFGKLQLRSFPNAYDRSAAGIGDEFGVSYVSRFWEVAASQLPKIGRSKNAKASQPVPTAPAELSPAKGPH